MTISELSLQIRNWPKNGWFPFLSCVNSYDTAMQKMFLLIHYVIAISMGDTKYNGLVIG